MSEFTGPIFVIGFPRSGTKLLRALLANHTAISIPNWESQCIPSLCRRFHEFGDLRDRAAFHRWFDHTRKHEFFRRTQSMPEYHGDLTEQRWFDSLKDYSFAAVIETYYRLMATAEGATIWGDKTPQYLTNIALLKSLYGSARFIHMVRDVRDVVVSNQRAWGAHPLRCAQVWADQVLECVTQSSKLPAGEFLTVRYESLLTDTEGVLRQACQLMGVDFENGMLSLDRPVETVGRARQAGIAKENFGKWRDALSSEQVAMIESVALDTMNVLEYETSDSRSRKRIGKTMMSWLKVRGVIGRFAYDVGEQDGFIKALVYRYNKRRYR